MKRFSLYAMLSAASLLLAVASCTSDNLQIKDGSYITLSLSSKISAKPDITETKAETKPGVDELNENAIETIYYFFYKKGETNTVPVIKGRLAGLDQKGSSTRTEDIPVASNAATILFDGSTECQAFIVANPPKSIESTLGGTPTLEELRTLTLMTAFKETQESFTMVFDTTARQSAPSGNIMTVTANMQRLASKLTFAVNTAKTCTDAGSTWTSDPDKAKITFYNAFKRANLAGDFESVKVDSCYFNSDAISFAEKTAKGSDTWHNEAKQPVYSYPETWDFIGSKEPYVLIELPWTKSGATASVTYYYKIFLDAKELKMNTWCHLTVNINELGSTTSDNPKQLFSNLNYQVLNWNTAFKAGEGITADIDDARYLLVPKTEYFLYNQDSFDIPFTSSHDCEIVVETYERMDYRNNDVGSNINKNSSSLGSSYSCSLDESLIYFTHTLNNNFDSTTVINKVNYGAYDVVKYDFKIKIQHENHPEYSQEIIIHQYPAIYIEAQANTTGNKLVVNTPSTAFVNIHTGLVANVQRDNGYSITGYYYGYGGDSYTRTTLPGNVNGNMYVVTSSVAPVINGKQYMLGDPRTFEHAVPKHFQEARIIGKDDYQQFEPVTGWANDNFLLFRSLPALYGDTPRTLTYYYPTSDSVDVADVIAPKFRVASSWGATTAVNAKKAVARCAAYQEDGYPAGRWRLPTAAELLYIIKLSSDHQIPMLFGAAGDPAATPTGYYCSTGIVNVYKSEDADGNKINAYSPPEYIYIDPKATPTDRYWLRCVYDDWYWENRDADVQNTTYNIQKGRMPAGSYDVRIWGDMPR